MSNYREELHQIAGGEVPLIEIRMLALLTDPQGNILMVRRPDYPYWMLPGSWYEPGETITESMQRSIQNDYGFKMEECSLLKVFSSPTQSYMSEDSVKICPVYFLICPRKIRGSLRVRPRTGEEIRFFAPENLPMDRVFPPMRGVLEFFRDHFADESEKPDPENYPEIL